MSDVQARCSRFVLCEHGRGIAFVLLNFLDLPNIMDRAALAETYPRICYTKEYSQTSLAICAPLKPFSSPR